MKYSTTAGTAQSTGNAVLCSMTRQNEDHAGEQEMRENRGGCPIPIDGERVDQDQAAKSGREGKLMEAVFSASLPSCRL